MTNKILGRLLIAATALTPLAPAIAQAQQAEVVLAKQGDGDRERGGWGRGGRGGGGEARQRGDNGGDDARGRSERPAPRVEQREAPAPRAPRGPEVRQREWQGGGDEVRQRDGRDNRGDARVERRDRSGGLSERGVTSPRTDSRDGWRDGDRRYDDRRDGDRRYDDRRTDGRSYDDRRDGYRDGYRDGRRDDDRRWDNQWRSDRRYDWRGHRQRYGSYYRLPQYYSPYRNHRYTRFSIGFSLWPNFYSSRYWISDPWYYRLPATYGPYRWVRYYDDVLLVDLHNGRVVDVIYDFFW